MHSPGMKFTVGFNPESIARICYRIITEWLQLKFRAVVIICLLTEEGALDFPGFHAGLCFGYTGSA